MAKNGHSVIRTRISRSHIQSLKLHVAEGRTYVQASERLAMAEEGLSSFVHLDYMPLK